MRTIIDLEETMKCIREIESGKSIDQVAKEKYIKPDVIRAYLLEYGGVRGKNILLKELEEKLPISIEEMLEKYASGKTTKDISNELGVTYNWLMDKITRYESISGRKFPRKRTNNKRNDLDEDYIIGEDISGVTFAKIAEDCDASVTAIQRLINEYKIKTGENIEEKRQKSVEKIRKEKERKKRKSITRKKTPEEVMEQEKEKVKLIEEIIRKYGYSYEQLSKIAENKRYKVSREIYYQALNNIKRDEERDE